MEAAKAERKRLEAQNSDPTYRDIPPKTEIIREYLQKPMEQNSDQPLTVIPTTANVQPQNNILNSLATDPVPAKTSEAEQYLRTAKAQLEKEDGISAQNFTESHDPSAKLESLDDSNKTSHLPLGPKPNILEISTDSLGKTNTSFVEEYQLKETPSAPTKDKAFIQNNIVKSPVTYTENSKSTCHNNLCEEGPKQVTFTNSQNVGTSHKITPSPIVSARISGLAFLSTNITPSEESLLRKQSFQSTDLSSRTKIVQSALRYTSSLRLPFDTPAHEDIVMYSTVDGRSFVHKSYSTDSVNQLELEDSDSEDQDCTVLFRPRKLRKRKEIVPSSSNIFDKSSIFKKIVEPQAIGEMKTIIVSIDNNDSHQMNNCVSSTTILVDGGKESTSSRSSTSSVVPLEQRLYIQEDEYCRPKNNVVILDVGDVKSNIPSNLSIKDEVDPIPRPERTESVRHRTRRRSGKKVNYKAKPASKPPDKPPSPPKSVSDDSGAKYPQVGDFETKFDSGFDIPYQFLDSANDNQLVSREKNNISSTTSLEPLLELKDDVLFIKESSSSGSEEPTFQDVKSVNIIEMEDRRSKSSHSKVSQL